MPIVNFCKKCPKIIKKLDFHGRLIILKNVFLRHFLNFPVLAYRRIRGLEKAILKNT
jgi:hypothetical protein